MNCVTGSVTYVNDQIKSKVGLLSLFSGEKVVMRSIFVAALAAASVLLAGAVSAEGCNSSRRPLVTVAPTPVESVSNELVVDAN